MAGNPIEVYVRVDLVYIICDVFLLERLYGTHSVCVNYDIFSVCGLHVVGPSQWQLPQFVMVRNYLKGGSDPCSIHALMPQPPYAWWGQHIHQCNTHQSPRCSLLSGLRELSREVRCHWVWICSPIMALWSRCIGIHAKGVSVTIPSMEHQFFKE